MKRNSVSHLIALLIIITYLSPALFWGEASYVMVHDHLDGAFVMNKVLAESGQMFGTWDATIKNVMNGIPVASIGSPLNVTRWLFYFFKPFDAYVINQLLIRIIAYCGMYLLLKRYFLKESSDHIAVIGASLTFALLPYYALFGLSVAGEPLAVYAFLNIRQQQDKWFDWAVIAAIPFYSFFILSYCFLLPVLGLWWLYDIFFTKRINYRFLSAIAIMTIATLIVEYRLLMVFFAPEAGFISHRIEFVIPKTTFSEGIYQAINNFIQGQGHAASMQNKIVLPCIMLALFLLACRRIKNIQLLGLLSITTLLSLWYGVWTIPWFELKQAFPNLPYMNISRAHFFHPLLWYLMFGIALATIWKYLPIIGKPLVLVLIFTQTLFLFKRSDYITEKNLSKPTYQEFFSEALFKEIDQYIGKDKSSYRVCSLGIYPSIPLYNGFYTLDGYSENYPLTYKKQFRQIIAKELDKNEIYRNYYDEWGSRFYIFANELEPLKTEAYMLTKTAVPIYKAHVNDLQFNTLAFKKMGGKYLFSALTIGNAEHIGLHLEKIFERTDSPWKIYLYVAR